jgi:hypothetical protein
VHLDARGRRDVGRGDRTRTRLAQIHGDRFVLLGGDDQVLEIEDDLRDVLDHARDRGELVQVAVDLDRGHCCTWDGRQERTPDRVAQRVAEAGLERLDGETGAVVADDLFGQGGALCDQHFFFLPRTDRYLTVRTSPASDGRGATSACGRDLLLTSPKFPMLHGKLALSIANFLWNLPVSHATWGTDSIQKCSWHPGYLL